MILNFQLQQDGNSCPLLLCEVLNFDMKTLASRGSFGLLIHVLFSCVPQEMDSVIQACELTSALIGQYDGTGL